MDALTVWSSIAKRARPSGTQVLPVHDVAPALAPPLPPPPRPGRVRRCREDDPSPRGAAHARRLSPRGVDGPPTALPVDGPASAVAVASKPTRASDAGHVIAFAFVGHLVLHDYLSGDVTVDGVTKRKRFVCEFGPTKFDKWPQLSCPRQGPQWGPG